MDPRRQQDPAHQLRGLADVPGRLHPRSQRVRNLWPGTQAWPQEVGCVHGKQMGMPPARRRRARQGYPLPQGPRARQQGTAAARLRTWSHGRDAIQEGQARPRGPQLPPDRKPSHHLRQPRAQGHRRPEALPGEALATGAPPCMGSRAWAGATRPHRRLQTRQAHHRRSRDNARSHRVHHLRRKHAAQHHPQLPARHQRHHAPGRPHQPRNKEAAT